MCSYIRAPFFTKFQLGCSSSTCSYMRVFTVSVLMVDVAIGGTVQLNTSEMIKGLDMDQNIGTSCEK